MQILCCDAAENLEDQKKKTEVSLNNDWNFFWQGAKLCIPEVIGG